MLLKYNINLTGKINNQLFMSEQDNIYKVFSKITEKYDIMNDVMSLGFHRLWKKKLLELIAINENYNYLDIATGSGDIAIGINRKLNEKFYNNSTITILDSDSKMLEIAKKRLKNENCKLLKIINSSATSIPLENESQDLVTISFGIRNVVDKESALNEMFRVLKKNGTLLCMEFSPKMNNDLADKFYTMYRRKIIPSIGKIVAGERDSYQYLSDSIEQFPDSNKFKDLLKKSGFKFVDHKEIFSGICCIYIAKKYE